MGAQYKLVQMRLNMELDKELIGWINKHKMQPGHVKELLKIIQVLSEEANTVDVARLMAYIKNKQSDQQVKEQQMVQKIDSNVKEQDDEIEEKTDEAERDTNIDGNYWLHQMENM